MSKLVSNTGNHSVGSGLNAGRNISKGGTSYSNIDEDDYYESAEILLNQSPEMVVSENVRVTGVVNFKRLFRIDGSANATFMAPKEASLIVGQKGQVTGDIVGIDTMYVEGQVKGNIDVRSLCVKSSATISGNVRCRFIEIFPRAIIKGSVNVLTNEEYKKLNPKDPPEEPPPPPEKIKSMLFIIDPQVDFLPSGNFAVAGTDEDCNKVADYIINNMDSIDEIYITLESRHKMNISHAMYWVDEQGEHPKSNTIITYDDIINGVYSPVNKENIEHCLYYTKTLEEQGGIHQLVIVPEHCLIGTPGHAVVPVLNKALQQWSGITAKQVHYIMKGQNCETIMYSGLSADVPIESDSNTYADNELIGKFYSAQKIIICGQTLSHSVNYTTRDLLRLLYLYQQQSVDLDDNTDIKSTEVANKLYLLKDCCSIRRGYEDQANTFIQDMKKKMV
eukprot:TRINITY_DN21245_c0_g1_i1.p1 TRINITY_DN21245_c0_g1~~TRINITY_DN21245_c0_g1_i1.p1  ORF type:complete len:448 (+),score=2.76 TRINITY_DN21245_c0_g1_i1:64-1407(+)